MVDLITREVVSCKKCRGDVEVAGDHNELYLCNSCGAFFSRVEALEDCCLNHQDVFVKQVNTLSRELEMLMIQKQALRESLVEEFRSKNPKKMRVVR